MGDLQTLGSLTDWNPLLVSQLIEEEWSAIELLLERGRALPGAKLYKNVRSYLSRQKRERLLKFIIPKVVAEGGSLYERGAPTPLRELRSYKVGREWDLDATLDQMLSLAQRRPDYPAIRMRKELETRRAFVILADQSNSLAKYIHYVALATAMLSFALKMEHLAVAGFQAETSLLKGLHQPVPLDLLLTRILDLNCGGATDLYKPLAQAQKELGSLPGGVRRQVILISDCTPTTGRNPLPLTWGLSRLHILFIPPVAFADCCLIAPLAHLENTRIYEVRRFEDIVDHVQAIVSQDERE